MKRIGFVGLSTPVSYDYRYQATKTHADQYSSPNPIVEGAFGAMLLYDEIWFLCRSLCPENMRDLPYVKFLDELGKAPDIDPEWLPDPDDIFSRSTLEENEQHMSYEDVKANIGVCWDAAGDNHTHGLSINGYSLGGNCFDPRRYLYDLATIDSLEPGVELIHNSYTAHFSGAACTRKSVELVEALTLKNVPQYLTPSGPYHESIEDLRGCDFLVDFRKWVVSESSSADRKDIHAIEVEVESKLNENRDIALMKSIYKGSIFTATAKTMIGTCVDLFAPGSSLINKVRECHRDWKSTRNIRWQGFLVQARNIVSRKI